MGMYLDCLSLGILKVLCSVLIPLGLIKHRLHTYKRAHTSLSFLHEPACQSVGTPLGKSYVTVLVSTLAASIDSTGYRYFGPE